MKLQAGSINSVAPDWDPKQSKSQRFGGYCRNWKPSIRDAGLDQKCWVRHCAFYSASTWYCQV